MILTQAPLRISFLGGGTDFPEFYATEEGCVLSSTIDKYISVIVKRRFDDLIRVGYTQTELVERVDELEHELVRESLRLCRVEKGVELATMGDIPSRGSGLGSSSTVTVALLHALWSYQRSLPSREQLAREAVAIEREILGRPIGVQDQYAAAYGGLNLICFEGEDVRVMPLVDGERLARRLGERLMLFFTGLTRQSSSVLTEQKANIEEKRSLLRELADMARQGHRALEMGDLDMLGLLMHEGWLLKRQMASGITRPELDEMYRCARQAGALGGKISGAGGGGFLLLYCPPERQPMVRDALAGYTELEFALEPEGSVILLHHRRR